MKYYLGIVMCIVVLIIGGGVVRAGAEYPLELVQVSFDGRTERIDITIHEDLTESDAISIEGVKSTPYVLQGPLDAGTYHIHDGEQSDFIGTCSGVADAGLNITDTTGGVITVSLNGTLISTYERDQSVTALVDNTDNTLQWAGGSLATATAMLCGTPPVEPTQPTEPVVPTEQQEIDQGTLYIEEIHPKNDKYGEFVEIVCSECLGIYTLHGFGSGSTTIDVEIDELFTGRLVVVGDGSVLTGYIPTNEIGSVSLSDSGEDLAIYGQYGQVMDTVQYLSGIGDDQSRYSAGQVGKSTPGLSMQYREVLQPDEEESISREECENQSTQDIKQVLDHDPSRVSSIDPREVRANDLIIQIEQAGHTIKNTGNIQRNESDCPDIVLPDETICPNETTSDSIPTVLVENPDPTNSGEGDTPPPSFSGSITLVSVLPDPEGTDAGNEQIIVQSSVGRDEVAEITITVNDVDKIYERDPDYRSVDGDTLLIQGSLRLRNSDACVQAHIGSSLSNEICYTETNPGEEIALGSPLETLTQDSKKLPELSSALLNTKRMYSTTITALQQENTKLIQGNSSLSTANDIADELFFMRKHHIQDEFPGIYNDSELERSYTLYRDIKQSREVLLSTGLLPVETFEGYVALQTGTVPLDAVSLPTLIDEYLL